MRRISAPMFEFSPTLEASPTLFSPTSGLGWSGGFDLCFEFPSILLRLCVSPSELLLVTGVSLPVLGCRVGVGVTPLADTSSSASLWRGSRVRDRLMVEFLIHSSCCSCIFFQANSLSSRHFLDTSSCSFCQTRASSNTLAIRPSCCTSVFAVSSSPVRIERTSSLLCSTSVMIFCVRTLSSSRSILCSSRCDFISRTTSSFISRCLSSWILIILSWLSSCCFWSVFIIFS